MFGDIGKMMKQAQELKARMAEMQDEIKRTEVTGASGGGLVQLKLSGAGELRGLAIDPSLMNPDEAEILEDLIVAAHADAKAHLEKTLAERMGALTGGLDLPPGFKLPF